MSGYRQENLFFFFFQNPFFLRSFWILYQCKYNSNPCCFFFFFPPALLAALGSYSEGFLYFLYSLLSELTFAFTASSAQGAWHCLSLGVRHQRWWARHPGVSSSSWGCYWCLLLFDRHVSDSRTVQQAGGLWHCQDQGIMFFFINSLSFLRILHLIGGEVQNYWRCQQW